MALSNELISQFVKVTRDETTKKQESTVYGTITKYDDKTYVKIDGSELLTPVSTTTDAKDGERVTVRIKNHTATATGNVTSPAARIGTVNEISDRVDSIEATYVKTEVLEADYATIETLEAEKANIENLIASEAIIEDLKANNATIESLVAEKIDATNAKIETLEADVAKIDVLEADVADINTLMFGDAAGDTLHVDFANAMVQLINQAAIDNALIESLNAGKVLAGSIDTGLVNLVGDNNRMTIEDGTIQISDANGNIRVQIGKDASEDYSLNVWDASGNLMFSEGGLTADAVKSKIIRDDMVSDDANIQSGKLDIGHLFSDEIEVTDEDGNTTTTKTLKSSYVSMSDGTTLSVGFNELSSTVSDTKSTVTSQGTAIETLQGQISSKIWLQEIDGRNLLLDSGIEYTNENYKVSEYVPATPLVADETYTVSLCVTPAANVTRVKLFTSNGYKALAYIPVSGTDEEIVTSTFTMAYYEGRTPDDDIEYANIQVYRDPNDGTVTGATTVHWVKIEAGDIATDWTSAPEDTVTLTTKYSTLDQTLEGFKFEVSETYTTDGDIEAAKQSVISQTADMIKNSVVGTDGETLMTQTETGWQFDFNSATTLVATGVVNAETAELTETVDILVGNVSNTQQGLEELQNYIRLGETADDSSAVLEIGGTNGFTLHLASDGLTFMGTDGTEPAYIAVDSETEISKLFINDAEVEGELSVRCPDVAGGIVITQRANGNVGFIWKE